MANYHYIGFSARSAIERAGLTETVLFDEAQRPRSLSARRANGEAIYFEMPQYSSRGLLTRAERKDLGGRGEVWDLDLAGRLIDAQRRRFSPEGEVIVGSQVFSPVPTSTSFIFDEADNLLSWTEKRACETDAVTSFPLDGSGRNRPASAGDETLAWDARGNLVQKGTKTFVWDGLDRLIEVKEGATTLAKFEYDPLNRRTARIINGERFEIVWNGWQPIEEYRVAGNQETLVSRRVFGAGIDEMVRIEQALDQSGQMTAYTPVFDAKGNLVVLADLNGKPIERYDYTAYGERFIWTDLEPPSVEQVILRDQKIEIELSEEVTEESIARLRNEILLVNLSDVSAIPFVLEKGWNTGRQAGHRLVMTFAPPPPPANPEDPPPQLQVNVPQNVLTDFFQNVGTGPLIEQVFTWNGSADQVLNDATPPKVESICIEGGQLKIELSERANPVTAAAAILIDGQPTTWTALPDGYTLQGAVALTNEAHTVAIAAGSAAALDLAGLGLAQPASFSFAVEGGHKLVFSAPFPGEVSASTVGNRFGFKGLEVEPTLGLIYMRNRWYDPEMGRFLSADPMGYADSPNASQFALNNPASYSDPTGESATGIGAISGGVVGGLYGLYRSAADGEAYDWSYLAQGVIAGAAVGFGIDTLGAGTGISATVIGGAGIGFGLGGAAGSVMSGGSWSEFGVGAAKGGLLGGIGGATGYGIAGANLGWGWALAGSVAADTYAGVGIDTAFGDCALVADCFSSNLKFSLGGNVVGYGLKHLSGEIWPRPSPRGLSRMRNYRRGQIGTIELDKYSAPTGKWEHGSRNIVLSRRAIRNVAKILSKRPANEELIVTAYHEAFHRGFRPIRQIASTLAFVDDIADHWRPWRLGEGPSGISVGQGPGLHRRSR